MPESIGFVPREDQPMADRVEDYLLDNRSTRAELAEIILSGQDHRRERLLEASQLRSERDEAQGDTASLQRTRDYLQTELNEVSQRVVMQEARASRYLRTLQDMVRLDRSDQERALIENPNQQHGWYG